MSECGHFRLLNPIFKLFKQNQVFTLLEDVSLGHKEDVRKDLFYYTPCCAGGPNAICSLLSWSLT